jgi:hypothetical protein
VFRVAPAPKQRLKWLLEKLGFVLPRDFATALSERDRAVAERDRAMAERDLAVAERDRAECDLAVAERDLAVVERDLAVVEHDEVADRFPALINAALIERSAFLEQRNQAYAEVDDLCRERNQLKAELARVARESAADTEQPLNVPVRNKL